MAPKIEKVLVDRKHFVVFRFINSLQKQPFLLAKRPQRRGARRKGCFRRLELLLLSEATETL